MSKSKKGAKGKASEPKKKLTPEEVANAEKAFEPSKDGNGAIEATAQNTGVAGANGSQPQDSAEETTPQPTRENNRVATKTESGDKVVAGQAKWRAKNKDKVREYQKAWRKKNAAKVKAAHLKYQKEHPDKVKEWHEKSQAKQKELLALGKAQKQAAEAASTDQATSEPEQVAAAS